MIRERYCISGKEFQVKTSVPIFINDMSRKTLYKGSYIIYNPKTQ